MPKGSSTKHHCPKQSQGNCVRANGICTAHQVACDIHQKFHLQDEPCKHCEGEKRRAEEQQKRDEEVRLEVEKVQEVENEKSKRKSKWGQRFQ